MIFLAFFLMMWDCILNTVLLTQNTKDPQKFAYQCNLQIVITVVFFFGVMSIYYARMWRVKKVFSLY